MRAVYVLRILVVLELTLSLMHCWFVFFQAEDGIRDLVRSRGLGDVYKRQVVLGLLAAWQVFIGEEVLLLTAIGLAIAAPVVLAHHREVLRPLARGLALGAGVCLAIVCLLYTSPSPRDRTRSRMPSSA